MDAINDYHVGYPDLSGLGAAFLTVLAEGDDGTLAVYSGLVALPPATSDGYRAARTAAAALVVLRGTKERYERAVTYFPTLRRDQYRN